MSEQQKILVTGGAGYIGSHTCKTLSQAGYLPITYDNLSAGHRAAVRWGPLIVGDLHDLPLLRKTLSHHQPIAVIHFAANALVGESTLNPLKYYHNNVTGTLALLQAMKEEGIVHLIFSSSCVTYGNPLFVPMDENHPQNPINPYGRSKKMIEDILLDFDKAYGIHSISLRYFNAAGADLEGEIGENHREETHLVPLLLCSLLQGTSLSVYGVDYDTKDGSAIRDYIHVTDLAEAHLQALHLLLKTKKSDQFNLGSGKGISVLEMIGLAEKICKQKAHFKIVPRREGDPPVLIASPQKAFSFLHWKPLYSDPDLILQSAFRWHKTLLKP